uniref:Major sperm protein n=1 Tax=Panagrolaimus davidi TaxID=227884 RepID=A0A914PE24_9BILA
MTFGEVVLLVIIMVLLYLLDQERKLHGRPGIPILGELFDSATGVEERPPISTATTAATEEPFNAEELKELEKAKHKKSPPPEKPECEVKSLRSTKTARTLSERTTSVIDVNKSMPKDNNNGSEKQQTLTPLVTSVSSPAPSTPPPPVKKNDDSSRREKAPETPPSVQTPKTSTYLPVQGENPMLSDSNYRLHSTASNTSVTGFSSNSDSSTTGGVEGDKNPDDLVFVPTTKLVYNGPFDYQAITYHMTVKNNSRKHIAYAIKSNAIPRVTALPPSGILKPGDKHNIAITVQRFNYDELDVSKDRIAYDYLFCPPETKVFTHSLLQGTATRRRKNIKIEYNP